MIKKLLRPSIAKVTPYSSARDEFKEFDTEKNIFIDANENPFENNVNRYPDPYQKKLKKHIASLKKSNPDQILIGNGSDEIIDLIIRAFCEPKEDEIMSISPSYGMYKVLAAINDISFSEILLRDDFSLDIQAIIAHFTPKTKILFLCSPNNPTGNSFDLEAILYLTKKLQALVVVDEAYIDFSTQPSLLQVLQDYPNLFIIQTLSKAYGMAGLRLGIGIGSIELITILNKIKPPYNINELSQQKAITLLQDKELIKNNIEILIQERKRLIEAFQNIKFIQKIYPSDANFILIKVDNATQRYTELLKQKIVVRNRTHEPLCENCLRISVGTPRENDYLITVMQKML